MSDPTSDAALLALVPTFADAPDMPIDVARLELASLARLAKTQSKLLAKVGIDGDAIDRLGGFVKRLAALEKAWQRSRAGVRFTALQKKQRDEAEQLKTKMLTGGAWACRNDQEALDELSRIREGSGLADTVQDLRDLGDFWTNYPTERKHTDIADADLKRAAVLAEALDEAAANEASDVEAAAALDLRNRCYWAADALAKEVREGGRYALRLTPKLAAKFTSRYRATARRRSKQTAKIKKGAAAPATKKGADTP